MSAASELREAIAMKYKAVVFDEWDYADFLTNGLDSFIDSTLDAVIAALPELPVKLDTSDMGHFSDKAYYGTRARYNALSEVRDLLQSAKTQKGEE